MFEKISQRSESLDDLIDDFADVIKDAYGVNELGDPHVPSEESVYTVGRILSTATDSSKVTANSLVLESSRLLGGGKRISLRFAGGQLKVRGGAAGVMGFGLFPGCLVCVKGRNGGGGVFVVDEVLLVCENHVAWLTIASAECTRSDAHTRAAGLSARRETRGSTNVIYDCRWAIYPGR